MAAGLCLVFVLVVAVPRPGDAASPQRSGAGLENALIELLSLYGFEVLTASESLPRGSADAGRLARQMVPYETIYGSQGYVDFVLTAPAFDRPVWLEAKRQQSRGSADQKLPYVLRTAAEAYPDVRVILILDGEGWRDGALDWARERAAAIPGKPVHVMDYLEFRDWLIRALN